MFDVMMATHSFAEVMPMSVDLIANSDDVGLAIQSMKSDLDNYVEIDDRGYMYNDLHPILRKTQM